MLNDLINRCQAGQIQVVVSSDPLALMPALQHSLLEGMAQRLMMLIWKVLPTHDQILNDVLHQMATLALEVFPAWYTGPQILEAIQVTSIEQLLTQEPALANLQRRLPRLSLPWLKQAVGSTSKGSPPLVGEFNRTLQCEQLALALDLSHGVPVQGVGRKPRPIAVHGL